MAARVLTAQDGEQPNAIPRQLVTITQQNTIQTLRRIGIAASHVEKNVFCFASFGMGLKLMENLLKVMKSIFSPLELLESKLLLYQL